MARDWIVGGALVALGLLPAGCVDSHPGLGRNQILQDPEFMADFARNGGQPAAGARSQKPDEKPPDSVLDLPPDRPADAPRGGSGIRIRAVVNDQAILDEDVQAAAFMELGRAQALPEPERSRRSAEIFNENLNHIIEREVVLQDAFARLKGGDKGGGVGDRYVKKLHEAAGKDFETRYLTNFKAATGFKTDEEVRRFFTSQGISLASFRRQRERDFMEFEYLRSRIFPILETRVNHQMLLDYYEHHPEEFQVTDSVEWQDLFVAAGGRAHPSREEARAFAQSLAEQARKGADFAQLVKQYDEGDSSLRGGEGVGRKRGEIRPAEAEEALFKMSDGQVGALLEIPTGFHVVKLVHRQNAGQLPFDDKVQKQIRDKLRNKVFQDEMKKIIAELKRKAVIEVCHK